MAANTNKPIVFDRLVTHKKNVQNYFVVYKSYADLWLLVVMVIVMVLIVMVTCQLSVTPSFNLSHVDAMLASRAT